MASYFTLCHSFRTNIRGDTRLCWQGLYSSCQDVRVYWHTRTWLSKHHYDGPLGQSLFHVFASLRPNKKKSLFECLRSLDRILLLRSFLLGEPSFDWTGNSARLNQIAFETLQCVSDYNHRSAVYHRKGSLWTALLESRGHHQKPNLLNDTQCAHVFCEFYGRRDSKER